MDTAEKINLLFGKHTDSEIAEKIGTSRRYISAYRKKKGIAPFLKWDRFKHLLGVRTDKEIAKLVGVTRSAVIRKRLRDGIPAIHESQEALLQRSFISSLKNPQEYVRTEYGIIDILCDDHIYELKNTLGLSSAQSAVGQLLIYSCAFPGRSLTIVTKRVRIENHVREQIEHLGITILEHKFHDIRRKDR